MKDEVVSSGIGFVDVLIGAMASVILLFIAQANRPARQPQFGNPGTQLTISVREQVREDDGGTPRPLPSLAIRYRLRQSPQAALAGDELRKARESRIFYGGEPDGASVHKLQLADKSVFEDGEELLVYVHDLNGHPRGPADIALRIQVHGKTAEVVELPSAKFLLDAEHPVLCLPLATVW